jgi:hypothetical protein
VLHIVLLVPGRYVLIGAHTFGVCVPTNMPRAGARSILVENNL